MGTWCPIELCHWQIRWRTHTKCLGTAPVPKLCFFNTPSIIIVHIIRFGLANYGWSVFLTLLIWKKNLAWGHGIPGNDTGRVCSLTAAGASVSVQMRQMVQSLPEQHPSPSWRNVMKILLHHHDNSCHTIAIVTGWTLLVFNHTPNGQRANEEEPLSSALLLLPPQPVFLQCNLTSFHVPPAPHHQPSSPPLPALQAQVCLIMGALIAPILLLDLWFPLSPYVIYQAKIKCK